MATREETHIVRSKEEVDDIVNDKGIPGYSETYVTMGPIEVDLTDGTKGWKVVTRTYYG